MLSGHAAFTSSLDHEYVGVLAHFADVVRGRVDDRPDGLAPPRPVTGAYGLERVATPGGAR
jgi:hypothetical protein